MFFFLNGAANPIPLGIAFIFVALFAFAYHELAHAVAADYLGDPTPRSYGRMTLNPFPHLDLVGFVLLILVGFGFASTPVNPTYFRGNQRVSHAIVAVVGPLTNLAMAILFALPLRFGLVTPQVPTGILPTVDMLLQMGIFINLLLFAFNLMPIPPLDGFTILLGVLPAELAYQLRPLSRYGFLVFIVIFFLLPNFGINVFQLVFSPVVETFYNVMGL